MSTSEPAGPVGPAGDDPADRPPPEPPPVPFVLSCATGALGLVLLVAGAALGNRALSVAGVVGGTLSLGAALYWRSLLISAWAAQKVQKRSPPRR